jgi:hypothetical protein
VEASSFVFSSSISATSSALPSPSAECPGYPKIGTIQVLSAGQAANLLGYIGNNGDTPNTISYAQLPNALQVQLDWAGADCSHPTDIAITMLNAPVAIASAPFLGFVGGLQGYNFAIGSAG